MLVSVTEGEDKLLKYPKIFKSANAVLITKVDLIPYLEFDCEKLEANLRAVAPQVEILAVSAKTGIGLPEWYALLARVRRFRGNAR